MCNTLPLAFLVIISKSFLLEENILWQEAFLIKDWLSADPGVGLLE
jgi:hypothetical protein